MGQTGGGRLERKPKRGTTTEWVSIQEAAARLSCSEKTLRRMISSGQIGGYRLGKRMLRVDMGEVEASLRRLPTARYDEGIDRRLR